MSTITNTAQSCVAGYGFPFSLEAGGFVKWAAHPRNNPPLPLCGMFTYSQPENPFRSDPPLTFPSLSLGASDSGATIFGAGFWLNGSTPQQPRPGQVAAQDVGPGPAWLAVGVPITNFVNFVQFDAGFTSTNGAQGLMTIYWNTNQIGMVDERVASPGLQSYRFALPGTVTNGLYTLSFRLAAFNNTSSSITVTNVATGFVGVTTPITLNVTLTNNTPLLHLTGASNFNYLVETSTNLLDWTPTALLSNSTGTVLFPDTTATNSSARFYRALLP